ncbi:hypothetical protein TNCV_393971 [Trichonephila clavipes]|nr:hypothetical protein TNCV_393971 [Trichonephila clavipes]
MPSSSAFGQGDKKATDGYPSEPVEYSHRILTVDVTDSWLECHELEPSTSEDPSCRGAMQVKSFERSNILL